MAHFARELDQAAVAGRHRGAGRRPPRRPGNRLCAVAGGYGADAAAADAVTAWIAETLRRGNPKGGLLGAVPRAPSRRARLCQHTQRRLVCRWL